MSKPNDKKTRVWMVERTYSDDEQNLIILVYATRDGKKYVRKERALTSFQGTGAEAEASILVDEDRLADVNDRETQERYAREAERMSERYEPGDFL